MMHDTERKALGAYYTDAQIADFLVWWAVRSSNDTVLDPSFGGGVFLRSASKRLKALGGHPAQQVFGAEIDGGVHTRIAEKLQDEFGVLPQNLWQADFFGVAPTTAPKVRAVIGNPPFIRYQRFTGPSRAVALAAAAAQGVQLSRLSSSWAPFLVHATGFLQPGGRLAMVVPAEIAHAGYARPVLDHLSRSFRVVTFLTFRKRLFPDLSEDTLLLLAEGQGEQHQSVLWRDFEHAGDLADLVRHGNPLGAEALDSEDFAAGHTKLVEQFIPPKARTLYRELQTASGVARLGDISRVGIGYVTGANAFFHPTDETVKQYEIPVRFLRRAARRGRDLVGLRYTDHDWHASQSLGDGGYLLWIQPRDLLPEGLARYIQQGEAAEVHHSYKCRIRSPWYSVPHVYQPDAFLTYMSGNAPRLVSNEAEAVAPNTLHIVQIKAGSDLSREALSTLWQTSLTRLSTEIEGHSLGGGMLKLEPSEAERVLIPLVGGMDHGLTEVGRKLDFLCRNGREAEARAMADSEILQRRLGLTRHDTELLQEAAELLRERRSSRGLSA